MNNNLDNEPYDEPYEYVISLGYNCSIANALIETCNRKYSFPYDWCMTTDIVLIEHFQNDFQTFFKRENFKKAKTTNRSACEYKDSDSTNPIIDYVHAGSYKNLMNDKYYADMNLMFQRRISRLLDILNSSKKVLFVRYYKSGDNYDNILKLINIIREKYTDLRFKILLFGYNNNNDNNEFVINAPEGTIYHIQRTLNKINTIKYEKLKKNYYN